MKLLLWRSTNFCFPLGLILPFSLMGFFLTLRDWKKLWLFYSCISLYALSVILFFVCSRYRLPLVPGFAILAGVGASAIANFFKRHEGKRLKIYLPILISASILSNLPLTVPGDDVDFEAEFYWLLGNAYYEQGDYQKATDWLVKSITRDSSRADFFNTLGLVLEESGDMEGAISNYRKAIRLIPEFRQASVNLRRLQARQIE